MRENKELPGIRFLELSGKPTDEELATYLDQERRRLTTSRPVPSLVVLRLTEVWTSTQRKTMRDFEMNMEPKTRAQNLGMAMVVPNSFIRGAFTAYFWVAPPAYPTEMVPTPEDAYDFAARRLAEARLPLPSRDAFTRVARSEWPGRIARAGVGMVPLEEAS